jgi:hypothetical protein
MSGTPEERLARQLRHVRLGWRQTRERPEVRERTERWLELHPSARPEVDLLWMESLAGRGPLAEWLAAGGEPSDWPGSPPLHSLLASHPFLELAAWSSPETSPAS